MISKFGSLLLLSSGAIAAPSRGNQDVKRNPFEEQLRNLVNDFSGLSGRKQGPKEIGRCAQRSCCAGADWNCQAPGSTCSCDQMCTVYEDCCSDYEEVCVAGNERSAMCDLRQGPQETPAEPVSVQIPEFSKVARASGDPHYHTFDGKTVHYQGGCIYQLAGLCEHAQEISVEGHTLQDFTVYAKNTQRFKNKGDLIRPMAWVQTIVVEFPIRDFDGNANGKKLVIIDQELAVRISNEYADGFTSVENIESTRLPYVVEDFEGFRIGIIYLQGNYVRVQIGSDGLTVGFNGKQNAKIHLPCQYNGNVCGLFGNSDNNPANDNLMPNGEGAFDDNMLGQSWLRTDFPQAAGLDADECAEDSLIGESPEEMCSEKSLRHAATQCKALIDPKGPFASCHTVLPPADFFEDCVYDMCLFVENKLDHTDAICEFMDTYGDECKDLGAGGLTWREEIQECAIECFAQNEKYYSTNFFEQSCNNGPVPINNEDGGEGLYQEKLRHTRK